ncbi:hypothetical protein [Rhizobium sp. 9140]|nr:hypothetical protein [Rhizobium sp. 9140]
MNSKTNLCLRAVIIVLSLTPSLAMAEDVPSRLSLSDARYIVENATSDC